jgi:hypothetical protein
LSKKEATLPHLIVLWEGDVVADGGLAPEDGAEAVEAKGEATVGGGPKLEGSQQKTELLPGLWIGRVSIMAIEPVKTLVTVHVEQTPE